MRVLGIDPGLDGGLAFMADNVAQVHAMPTRPTGRRSQREIDTGRLVSLILENGPIGFAVVERQQAMPAQGGVSMFTIGVGYGVLLGVLSARMVPYEIVAPKTWQREFGVGSGDTKAQAAVVASRLFPLAELRVSERARVPHTGIVDALLIAEWARRRQTPQVTHYEGQVG